MLAAPRLGPALKTTEADLPRQLSVPAQPSPHPPHRPGHRDVNDVLGNFTTKAFSLLKVSISVFSLIGISYRTPRHRQALNNKTCPHENETLVRKVNH